MPNVTSVSRFFDSTGTRKKKSLTAGLFVFFALFAVCSGRIAAQVAPTPSPNPVTRITPRPSTTVRRPPTTETPVITPRPMAIPSTKKKVINENAYPAEKSIMVDPEVSISLCFSGDIKINGWERDEVRAYVDNGSEIGFQVKRKRNGKPVILTVLGFDPVKIHQPGLDECLSGANIQLDVPIKAAVSIDSSEDASATVESVAQIKVKIVRGDISLNEISRKTEATTYDGDLTVENSKG